MQKNNREILKIVKPTDQTIAERRRNKDKMESKQDNTKPT